MNWVKNNIEFFGGDASKVTVFGESAGSLSTCFLSSSKLTENLFERAIMESGNCVDSPWGIQKNFND